MPYQSFLELDAWKLGRQFKLQVYDVLKGFPEIERFGLSSQLRRAVRSIPANIAEGHGRRTKKDQNNFCTITRGSHAEVLNHLIDAYDCAYISREELCSLKAQWDILGKTLNAYMRFLQSKIPNKRKDGASGTDINEDAVPYHYLPESKSAHEHFLQVLNSQHDRIN